MRLTVPDFGDGIWFIVFIASTISKVSPSDTELPTDKDINDWNTLSEIIELVGLPGDVVINAAQDQGVLEEFEDNTNRALDRGVFGIPSYVTDEEIFWGQDRLEFLEHRLG